MYRMYKELHGNDEAEDICWFAPSAVMNSKLQQHVIDRALARDAPKANAEYRNIWREDLADFIPLEVVENCIDFGVYERPPQSGVKYFSFCDSAGGTGADSFTLAIAHYDRARDTIIVDVLREYKPRFVPRAVITELAQLLKGYGVSSVMSDNFAGGFHADEWLRAGIMFRPCPRHHQRELSVRPAAVAIQPRPADRQCNIAIAACCVGAARVGQWRSSAASGSGFGA